MIRLLYDNFLRLLFLLLKLFPVNNSKIKEWISGQKDVFNRAKEDYSGTDCIWFHVASLGEYEQAKPVIDALRNSDLDKKVVLTFFSPSGMEKLRDSDVADFISYLPLDTKKNAERWIELIKPSMAVFVKYDLWLNHISALQKHSIPCLLIAAQFREDQYLFKWYGRPMKKRLKKMKVFVQNEESELIASKNNIENTLAGDTRVDRILTLAEEEFSSKQLTNFSASKRVLLAGSTWPKDEKLLLNLYTTKLLDSNWKMIIAPHEISDIHINSLIKEFPKSQRLSRFSGEAIDCLIIDEIGILKYLYKWAELAYIGGGFGKGIHSLLEPAAHGLRVIHGPNYKKFQEGKDLIKLDINRCVTDKESLVKSFLEICESQRREDIQQYLNQASGASSLVTSYILNYFNR